MNKPANVLPLKPTTTLKLKLLPPKEPEEITEEKIKNFYKNLVSILMEED